MFGIAVVSLDVAFMIVGLAVIITYTMRQVKLEKDFHWW